MNEENGEDRYDEKIPYSIWPNVQYAMRNDAIRAAMIAVAKT